MSALFCFGLVTDKDVFLLVLIIWEICVEITKFHLCAVSHWRQPRSTGRPRIFRSKSSPPLKVFCCGAAENSWTSPHTTAPTTCARRSWTGSLSAGQRVENVQKFAVDISGTKNTDYSCNPRVWNSIRVGFIDNHVCSKSNQAWFFWGFCWARESTEMTLSTTCQKRLNDVVVSKTTWGEFPPHLNLHLEGFRLWLWVFSHCVWNELFCWFKVFFQRLVNSRDDFTSNNQPACHRNSTIECVRIKLSLQLPWSPDC